MKISLIALNSRHIHTALGVRYLKASLRDRCSWADVEIVEGNINQPLNEIVKRVYETEPDVIGFSTYIFNIQSILNVAADLKKILPEAMIVFGGPEVSYAVEKYLKTYSFINFIVSGEGEESFCKIVQGLNEGVLANIPGVWLIDAAGEIVGAGPREIDDLDILPSPYDDDMLRQEAGRIIYFESSRGCPFSCSYCLSSAEKGVRYFSLERVKQELTKLFSSETRQVKFVDRTFNANPHRAAQIIQFIVDNYHNINTPPKNFHFEAAPDLFNEELFHVISGAPPGLIQFEVGIQSFNSCALGAVNRRVDMELARKNLQKLIEMGNVHVHIGLIAGLPEENFESFKNSFSEAYEIGAQQLQVGFLKMLHGTAIRNCADEFGYEYSEYPPYQILKSGWLTFLELNQLTQIGELVDRLYNSGKFCESLKYTMRNFTSPYKFFENLSEFITEKKIVIRECSLEFLYTLIIKFLIEQGKTYDQELLVSLLAFDYLISTRTNTLPKIFRRYMPREERLGKLVRAPAFVEAYIPEWIHKPSTNAINSLFLQKFPVNMEAYLESAQAEKKVTYCLFDYSQRHPVTKRYKVSFVNVLP